MTRTRTRRLLLAAVGLIVFLAFVLRRTGMLPEAGERFDPRDYASMAETRAEEAREQVGERAVICGTVVATTFARGTQGRPTYLNFERPYPDQPFDAVIWGRERGAFPAPPESMYRDRDVCVAGRVTRHRGVPRIEVRTPAQIELR